MAHIFIYNRKGDILANPNNPKGYYLCKVGYFDIRQTIVQPKRKKNFKGEWEITGGSSKVFIYHGKHKIEGPFKTKEASVIRAEEMMSEGIRYNKFGK